MFSFCDFFTASKDAALQAKLANQKQILFALHHSAAATASTNASSSSASAAATGVSASGFTETPCMNAVIRNACVIFGPQKCGKTSLLFHMAYEHAKSGGHPYLIMRAAPRDAASSLDSVSADVRAQELKPHLPRMQYEAKDEILKRIRIKTIVNEVELRVMLASLPLLTAPVASLPPTSSAAMSDSKSDGPAATATAMAAPVDLVLVDDFSAVHTYTPETFVAFQSSSSSSSSSSGGRGFGRGGGGGSKPHWSKDSYQFNPHAENEVLCKSLGILYSSMEYMTKIGRTCRVVLTDSHDPTHNDAHSRVVSLVFDRYIGHSFVIASQLLQSGEFRMLNRSSPSIVHTSNPSALLLPELSTRLAVPVIPSFAEPIAIPPAAAASASAAGATPTLPLVHEPVSPFRLPFAASAVSARLNALSTALTSAVIYRLSDTALDVTNVEAVPVPAAPRTTAAAAGFHTKPVTASASSAAAAAAAVSGVDDDELEMLANQLE